MKQQCIQTGHLNKKLFFQIIQYCILTVYLESDDEVKKVNIFKD